MTRQEIESMVLELLSYYCEIPRSEITLDMRVQEDLGLDSVDAAAILVVLEDRIGREIDLEAMEGVSTIESVVAALETMPDVAEALAASNLTDAELAG